MPRFNSCEEELAAYKQELQMARREEEMSVENAIGQAHEELANMFCRHIGNAAGWALKEKDRNGNTLEIRGTLAALQKLQDKATGAWGCPFTDSRITIDDLR